MRVLLLADTHLGPNGAARLLETLDDLVDADAIIHAGDVTDAAVLAALAEFAPVYAVLGNNDAGLQLPERDVVALGGCTVAIVHDSGPSAGRALRLRRWFPHADVVVFGHSHLPWLERHIDDDGHVQHHVNPGSAIQRRRAPRCTAAVLDIADGAVLDIRHVGLH